jgi:DNA-directed RNA polymerase subunit RPC12/RpoP
MGLMICPECKKEVSSQAVLCPNCGVPIGGLLKELSPSNRSTIQLTSNMLKMHAVLSSLLFWGGIVVAYNNFRDDPEATKYASIAILVGLVWYIVTKILTTEKSRPDT